MHILSQVEQDNGDFLFPLSYCKQVSLFMVYLLPSFSHFRGGFVISLFEMAPKHKAEMLSSNPKFKKVVMCLLENMCVLDKLQSGMGYRAPGCEFRVNEFTLYIKLCVFKHRHTLNKLMYWSADKNGVTRGLQEPVPVFPLGAALQHSLTQCWQCLCRTQALWISKYGHPPCVRWRVTVLHPAPAVPSLFILRHLFLLTELSSLMTLFRFPFCSSIHCYFLVRKKYLLSKDETWSVLCLDLGDCVVFFL